MNAANRFRALDHDGRATRLGFILILILTTSASATTQLLLTRDAEPEQADLRGVVELTVNPGLDEAHVTITMDGQKIGDALRSPYKVTVDFGPNAIEHRITVVATQGKKRVQWQETVNRGHLPLTVKVAAVDLANRLFEATATAPQDDPIQSVEVWDSGQKVAEAKEPPYRFVVPQSSIAAGFVQVTARTKSGDEAADFWSTAGDVHVESVDVRTVPIFVSVVDSNGQTRDDVAASMFRVIDNGTEAKILEFGKALEQPISIALLVDGSASMTYEINNATKAAMNFVDRTLKPGDRCAVFAVHDVPRRTQELTSDKTAVAKSIKAIEPGGTTALYDTVQAAIRELKNEKNRRAIVALTDGGDTASMASFAEIDRIVTEAGIPLYFIAYDSGDVTEQSDLDRLNYLAGQTGGFVATASQQNLQAKYAAIEKDLRAQFAIRYQITDFAKHNQWRKVRVVVNSPRLTARTIRGYFAP
jgi:Ca-activated chloride channel family protein